MALSLSGSSVPSALRKTGVVESVPAPPYVALTDNYSVRFNGQWCNYSRTVYTINGDVSRINPRLTDFFGSCGKRQLDTNDISKTVDTECVSYEDIELCLHIPITLFFPL